MNLCRSFIPNLRAQQGKIQFSIEKANSKKLYFDTFPPFLFLKLLKYFVFHLFNYNLSLIFPKIWKICKNFQRFQIQNIYNCCTVEIRILQKGAKNPGQSVSGIIKLAFLYLFSKLWHFLKILNKIGSKGNTFPSRLNSKFVYIFKFNNFAMERAFTFKAPS